MKKITNLFIVCYVTLFPLWMGTGGYSNIQEEKNGFLWIFIRLFLMTFGLEACIIMALYRDELKEVIIARKNILILTLAFAVNMIVAWLINGKDTSCQSRPSAVACLCHSTECWHGFACQSK